MSQNPTENLRRGRRRIEEIPEMILLKDWTWDVVTKRFYLHIRVCLDHDGKDIPRVTEWFVTAETVYPFGTIAPWHRMPWITRSTINTKRKSWACRRRSWAISGQTVPLGSGTRWW